MCNSPALNAGLALAAAGPVVLVRLTALVAHLHALGLCEAAIALLLGVFPDLIATEGGGSS